MEIVITQGIVRSRLNTQGSGLRDLTRESKP